MIMSKRALALFFGSLLIVSWILQIVALNIVGDVHADGMRPWMLVFMFQPTLWSLVYLAFFNRGAFKFIRFWPGNPLWLVAAALIPALIGFAVVGVSLFANWGASSYFNFTADGATVLRGPWVMGLGAQGWAFLVANIAATAIVFAGFNGLVAVGEEFGWRGVLQHHVIERFGFLRGVALLGFVWAIWHAPVNFAGYNYPQAPILGTVVYFTIELIAVSFIMAWITLKAKSFWPAVLMHGSGNGIQEGVVSSIKLHTGVWPMWADTAQLLVTVAIALVCLALSFPGRTKKTAESAAVASSA